MILRLSLMCMLGVVFVLVLGFEAEAYKCAEGYTYNCRSLGGTRICTCWKTGSDKKSSTDDLYEFLTVSFTTKPQIISVYPDKPNLSETKVVVVKGEI